MVNFEFILFLDFSYQWSHPIHLLIIQNHKENMVNKLKSQKKGKLEKNGTKQGLQYDEAIMHNHKFQIYKIFFRLKIQHRHRAAYLKKPFNCCLNGWKGLLSLNHCKSVFNICWGVVEIY